MSAPGHRLVIVIVAVLALARAVIAGTFSPPETVMVPAGPFIFGSDRAEHEYAYRLDEKAYGHSITRQNGWYDDEPQRRTATLPAFEIMKTPVTNALYQVFVRETGHRAPFVDAKTWAGYRLVHPYERAKKYMWKNGRPPAGRRNHPVVLVSYDDAVAFARWLSKKTGQNWHLPGRGQWEKAARGTDGRYFPWGNKFDPAKLNSHDLGPFDTMPVASFPGGKSPYGMLDAAGQVYEWTRTTSGKGRHMVKGGSWDDKGCGVCRPAAGHGRPDSIKHIIIGFRLVRQR